MTDLRKLLDEATKGKWKIQRRKMKKSGGAWAEIGTSFWYGFAKVAIRLDDDTEDSPEGVANVELMAMARNLAEALLKAEGALAEQHSYWRAQSDMELLSASRKPRAGDSTYYSTITPAMRKADALCSALTEIRKLTGAA